MEAITCNIAPCLQPSAKVLPTSCFLLCMLHHYQQHLFQWILIDISRVWSSGNHFPALHLNDREERNLISFGGTWKLLDVFHDSYSSYCMFVVYCIYIILSFCSITSLVSLYTQYILHVCPSQKSSPSTFAVHFLLFSLTRTKGLMMEDAAGCDIHLWFLELWNKWTWLEKQRAWRNKVGRKLK